MGRITNALKLLAGTNDAVGSPMATNDTPPVVLADPAAAATKSVMPADSAGPEAEARSVTAVSFHGPELHAPAIRHDADEPTGDSNPPSSGREPIGAGSGPAGYESPSDLWPDASDDGDLSSPFTGGGANSAGDSRGTRHPEGPTEFTTHDLSPVLFDSLDFSLQATRGLIAELQDEADQLEAWLPTLENVEFSTIISACSAAITEGEVAPRNELPETVPARQLDDDSGEPVIRTVIELEDTVEDEFSDELDLSFMEPMIELQSEESPNGDRLLDEVAVEPLAPLQPADDFAVDSELVVRPDAADVPELLNGESLVANHDPSLDDVWLPATTTANDAVWRDADELNWDLPTSFGDPLPASANEADSVADGELLELETVAATTYEQQLMTELSNHESRGAAVALAQSIRQTLPGSDSHVVLVLSPGPSADVADTMAQLAFLLAREEFARVLLVDANLAMSTLTERFEAQREGLLEAVLDGEPWDELVRATSIAGLHLLASGDTVTARGIQIQSEEIVRLRRLVSRWRHAYDYVLIDGGSVELPLTRDLVQQADSTFLQVCLGRTDEQQAAAAMQQLQLLGGQVRGCLVLDA
ncbi:MAG: cellulose synthase operon protein YhjQ/BcsQ [Pirellulales bacterium]